MKKLTTFFLTPCPHVYDNGCSVLMLISSANDHQAEDSFMTIV